MNQLAAAHPPLAGSSPPLRSADLDLRIRDELLKLVYGDQPLSLAAALIYAISVAAVLIEPVGLTGPLVWLAGITATIVARYALAVAYRRRQPPPGQHASWVRAFFVGALVMGLFWGALGWWFYPIVPPNYRVLIIMVVGGITAASSRSIASQVPTFCAFAAAAVLPLCTRLWLEGTTSGAFMGSFLLLFMGFMMGVARSFRNTIAKSFRLSFENADLAATLQLDIAARRAAEEALRASEERLRFTQYALDHAQDLVAILGRQGEFLHVSEAFCRHTGRSAADLRQARAWQAIAGRGEMHFHALWDEVKRRGALTFETDVLTQAGERKPVEVNASYLEFNGREAVCTIARDVTARRTAEQEKARMQTQLQETQRLESLGVLAGGIAHDFNNLLTAILGNATLARGALPRGAAQSEFGEMLGQIERAANQAAGLCRQMLAYAGKGRFVVEPVEFSALVADTAKLLEMTIARRAKLELRLAPGLPSVVADTAQMRQVVINLVHNAAEAISRPDGRIVVTTSRIRIDRALVAEARVTAAVDDGEGICLEVNDNGCGMDPATLERIFEPFFTTKFTGRGLGLAAVLGIVRAHRGLLHVQSEPGRGTTFRFILAAAPAEVKPKPAAPPRPALTRGQGHVLVVDDEDTVRNLARHALQQIGFTVDTAEDGEAAVALVARDVHRYKLILLDMTMPRRDGVLALQEIRRLGADARIILMSGFSEQQARERLGLDGVDGFLQKPFDFDTLRLKVDAVERAGEAPAALRAAAH